MIHLSPGVRRLCVCVDAPHRRLLGTACQTAGFGRLYTEQVNTEDIEIGFASPGVDEALLVTDLITALRAAAAEARIGPDCPALAAFHVGITRVEGDNLAGAAVVRIRELLRHLATASLPSFRTDSLLVVGISASLFDDIGIDCGFTSGWVRLTAAKAWFRNYGLSWT